MTLKFSQYRLITKMNQEFNYGVKSIITFNIPDTQHKGAVPKQEIGTKLQNKYIIDTIVP